MHGLALSLLLSEETLKQIGQNSETRPIKDLK